MTRIRFINPIVFAIIMLTILIGGCKPKILPLSSIYDTKENKAILKFMDLYKIAVEKHETSAILDLVAADFYEKNGSENPKDHYDREGLVQKLEESIKRIKKVRLNYHVQYVKQIPGTKKYEVIYFFVEHALVKLPNDKTDWMSVRDVNRLLIRQKGRKLARGFEILSGL